MRILWQQLSRIPSAATTGWQPTLLNASTDFAISRACAESLAYKLTSLHSDGGVWMNKHNAIMQVLKVERIHQSEFSFVSVLLEERNG